MFAHGYLDVNDSDRNSIQMSGFVWKLRLIEGQAHLRTTNHQGSIEKEGDMPFASRGRVSRYLRLPVPAICPIGFIGILLVCMGHVSRVLLTAKVDR